MKSEDFLETLGATARGRAATAAQAVLRMRMKSVMRVLLCATFLTLHSSLFISCSETDDELSSSDWHQLNDAYFLTLEDSLSNGPEWKKIKHFTKNPDIPGKATDYVYVKVLESGSGTESPLYNDTIRCSYELRLMPVEGYPNGAFVQKTFTGDFSWQTTGVFQFMLASSGTGGIAVEGFRTPFLHMHRGDRWRVYIPHQLAYGSNAQTSIPAYSTLVYDIALIDFWHPGDIVPAWRVRQK